MAAVASPRQNVWRRQRPLVFVLFVAAGFAIFLFGNNWTAAFPTNKSDLYKWSLVVLFGGVALVLRKPQAAQLRAIALALFSAALANAVMAVAGGPVLGLLPPPASGAQRLAFDKVAQAIPVVLTLLLVTLLVDRDLGAAFLRKSNRWGIQIGLAVFAAFAAIFVAIAVLQAGAPKTAGLTASGVPLSTLVAALPWILVFIFTNSFMEELWFRGIFLGKLRPVLGVTLAIVATALVFASPHFMAVYVSDAQRVLFAAIVFGLGLLNAWVMLKSDSIWGSVLIHAGYDLFVIIPMLVQLA